MRTKKLADSSIVFDTLSRRPFFCCASSNFLMTMEPFAVVCDYYRSGEKQK